MILNNGNKLEDKGAVDVFRAQTDRFKVQTDAQEVGAKLNESAGKQLGQQLDNINKELDNEHKEMENYEKFEQITNPAPDALIAITEVSDNMVDKPTGKSALNKMVDVGQSAMRRMTDA